MTNMKETCVICEGSIEVQSNGWRYGHNADPVREGRCCNDCNSMVVQNMRIRQMRAKIDARQMELFRKLDSVRHSE